MMIMVFNVRKYPNTSEIDVKIFHGKFHDFGFISTVLYIKKIYKSSAVKMIC